MEKFYAYGMGNRWNHSAYGIEIGIRDRGLSICRYIPVRKNPGGERDTFASHPRCMIFFMSGRPAHGENSERGGSGILVRGRPTAVRKAWDGQGVLLFL